ncbi:glycerol-3-phosphate dehydrogenase (NAD(P)+) [Chitinophaga skermanii]|uniref:Glycerol-3-phosphate dehydrogenase n=1 Tax=Chitinophaga skermanii TaxID=331697 RepID=A0A327R4I1_9BACT|nr:NAD(P)H-dependent glycerol-3-phosphate dehydrogenase [Chitinophaga skermanii]RAJ11125.1 glycerol-3-phosphate dehydrogenase (NAD(P)+) [Chitinophaga skermanii]
MTNVTRLTIVGGGSWATALVKIFAEGGLQITWLHRNAEAATYIQKHKRNRNYLSFLELDFNNISTTHLAQEAIAASDYILFAVPSAYLAATIAEWKDFDFTGKKIIVSIKGVVGEQHVVPSIYLAQFFNVDADDILVIGGPCHAEEIALQRKTYMTIAGKDKQLTSQLATQLNSPYLRVIDNNDPLGVEYAAILKNIIGIAVGTASGMNYGDNFIAVLVSNALREVKAFLHAVDDVPRDLTQSAYFGDLFVTAYSEFSRNRTFGKMIGRGYNVREAQAHMNMVAEGYYAVKGIYAIAQAKQLHMPIVAAMYRVLYNQASPYVEFQLLEQSLS